MKQVIKKGKFIAILRDGVYDVYSKDKYIFTISPKSALLLVSSDILKEISNEFKTK